MTSINKVSSGLYSRIIELEESGKIYTSKEADLEEFEAAELEDVDLIDELEPDSYSETFDVTKNKSCFSDSNPYLNSFFPVVFIDKKMQILFANDACKNLFFGYFELSGHYFADVFGKSFGIDEIRKIHEAITDGANGSFWKGEIKIKSRTMSSVQIRVFIFPADLRETEPSEFVVLFDDVTEEAKHATKATFKGLLDASKLKDNDTGNHITRVNFYSRRMAQELFLSKNPRYNRIDADFIDNIGFLASMHDVGKIGTPENILNKKEPLSAEEWAVMREHTQNGAFILSSYPNPMAREIAIAHHERWDGSGYPYLLSGEMIPLSARIVAIADVYDALRMERSYKPALGHKAAIQQMVKDKESHFDPFLIDILVTVEEDFRKIYSENYDEKRMQS